MTQFMKMSSVIFIQDYNYEVTLLGRIIPKSTYNTIPTLPRKHRQQNLQLGVSNSDHFPNTSHINTLQT